VDLEDLRLGQSSIVLDNDAKNPHYMFIALLTVKDDERGNTYMERLHTKDLVKRSYIEGEN